MASFTYLNWTRLILWLHVDLENFLIPWLCLEVSWLLLDHITCSNLRFLMLNWTLVVTRISVERSGCHWLFYLLILELLETYFILMRLYSLVLGWSLLINSNSSIILSLLSIAEHFRLQGCMIALVNLLDWNTLFVVWS